MKPTTAFRAVNAVSRVNWLYLIVLGLMVANIFLAWLPQYVRLTLNEILFVFLPGYIFLRFTGQRLQGQSLTERVRWHWPGWRIALLALLVGAGLYPLSAASVGVLMGMLGYKSFAAPADAIPTTALMGALAVLSYAILAPLCEEFLFRGILQPVYETRGAARGMLSVSFLFVAFHLSLLQGLSILLLALALGYVNYRTRSLPASMLTHFGANGLAALMVTQQVFPTSIQNWITSLPSLIGGLLMAGLALLALIRLTRTNQAVMLAAEDESAAPASLLAAPAGRAGSGCSAAWPLLAALLLYLPMIGVEWVFSRSPELVAGTQAPEPALQVAGSPWMEPHKWNYEIRNVADSVVGSGECRLTLAGEEMELVCTSTVQAYEVKQDQGTYASSGGQRIDTLRWKAANGKFLSGSSALDLQGGFASQVDFHLAEDRIIVRYQEKGQPEKALDLFFNQTALAKDPSLLLAPDYTWPWQLASLCQQKAEPGGVMRFNPFTWNQNTRSNGPLAEPRVIKVTPSTEVQTPARSFQACSAASGNRETVWYADIGGVLTIVKYFNGIETWYLNP